MTIDRDFLVQEEADLKASMTRAYKNMRAKLDAGEDATAARTYFHATVERHRMCVEELVEAKSTMLDARKATNAELAKAMWGAV